MVIGQGVILSKGVSMLTQEGTYYNNQYYLDICFWKRDHKHHRISGYRSLKHNRNYLRDSGAAYDEIQSNTKLPWRHRSRVNRVKHKDRIILSSWWDDRIRANRTAGWKNTKTRHQYKAA